MEVKKLICAFVVLVAIGIMFGFAGSLQCETIDDITAIIGAVGCLLVAIGAIKVGELDVWGE